MMKHHTKFCKWIQGVFVFFDHALGTNLKATGLVFLYFSDGNLIKFPINFRIFHQVTGKMLWQRSKIHPYQTKYELAVEILEWALKLGFPPSMTLADCWFCTGPFFKELKRLEHSYIIELKPNYMVRGSMSNA